MIVVAVVVVVVAVAVAVPVEVVAAAADVHLDLLLQLLLDLLLHLLLDLGAELLAPRVYAQGPHVAHVTADAVHRLGDVLAELRQLLGHPRQVAGVDVGEPRVHLAAQAVEPMHELLPHPWRQVRVLDLLARRHELRVDLALDLLGVDLVTVDDDAHTVAVHPRRRGRCGRCRGIGAGGATTTGGGGGAGGAGGPAAE